jgi:two-component system response regulator DevR
MQPLDGRPTAVRVVLVDADDRVRESLCGFLCIGGHVEVVGNAGAADPALEVVLATRPDVVILDPRLPGVDAGLTLIRRLRSVAPGVRILLMGATETPDHADVIRAADGVIRKTYRPTDLVRAVLAAAVPLVG